MNRRAEGEVFSLIRFILIVVTLILVSGWYFFITPIKDIPKLRDVKDVYVIGFVKKAKGNTYYIYNSNYKKGIKVLGVQDDLPDNGQLLVLYAVACPKKKTKAVDKFIRANKYPYTKLPVLKESARMAISFLLSFLSR